MKTTSEELLTKIRNQISLYQHNVESDNRAHRYNINDRAEAFTIPLFKIIFGWDELKDLNYIQANFPGIDLGDLKNKVAVQVTSETNISKVKDSLKLFIDNEHFLAFDRLVIFMLQGRQKSYNKTAIDNITTGKMEFDSKRDIIDLNDLLNFIKSHRLEDLKFILKLFEDETGYVESSWKNGSSEVPSSRFSAPYTPPYEDGFLNLTEIGFPESLYIADWNFTRKQLGTRMRNDRKLVTKALEQKDLKFAVDWVTFENQVISFHDLSDEFLPLANIVDQGTVTSLGTAEFYKNPAYRIKFVELLQKCLQQKLYRLSIHWQHKEKEFIFMPLGDQRVRTIKWKDQQTGTRTVYRQLPNMKDKTKIYCHEHFAFATSFYKFGSRWYLAVKPDWFYSTNGYDRAWYAIEDKRSYKKRVEANQNVSTHVRFIQSFIATNDPESTNQLDMFPQTTSMPSVYEFLWIKDRQEIKKLPRLPDAGWRGKKPSSGEHDAPLFTEAGY